MRLGLIFLISTLLSFSAGAQSGTILKSRLQKNLYDLIISQSNEYLNEKVKDGSFSLNRQKDRYTKIMAELCDVQRTLHCPPTYFANKKEDQKSVGIGSMYPNKVMVLYKELADQLSHVEISFIIAHEFAHFKYYHSVLRSYVLADAVVDGGFIVTEEENILGVAGFLPGIPEFHREMETQADVFAAKYLKSKGLTFDCDKMFEKLTMTEDQEVTTDQHVFDPKHESDGERCKLINKILN